MPHAQIRDLLDEVLVDVKFDHALYAKVCNMEAQFVNKKQEHIEFFGGNLTGVDVVRFTPTERDQFFHDVLQVDEGDLRDRLYALKDHAGKPLINQEWVVTSDVFNIASIWLIHGFSRSKILNEHQREEARIRVGCFLFYKFLTSLLAHYFKYPADRETAQATYEALSYKYALKQFGSWGETLRDLSEKAVGKESIHRQTVEAMDDDQRVIRMIGDLQGRIRDMLKNIYAEFVRCHQGGKKIVSTSSLVESDGELILKDNVKSPGVYARYLKSIVSDKNTFIRPELVEVIAAVMHTLSPRLLVRTLEWTSDNYLKVKDSRIEKAIDIVLEHAIEYMAVNRTLVRTDVANMIDKLRGAYMSSRSSDVKLLEARQLIGELVREATDSRNESMIATVRTSFMLYCVSRAYTMRFYANR
jgi:hypothetical protein